MKSVKFLFPILLLALVISSCSSSSSSNSTKVKYQISGLDNSVVNIRFYDAAGSLNELTDYTQFGGGGDSKTISLTSKPFDALLQVGVNNTGATVKTYVLVIYVDNVVKSSYNLSVPASTNTSGLVEFTVPNS